MNENETVADIVAKMRDGAKYARQYDYGVRADVIESYADRIEAAVERMAVPTPEQWTEIARVKSENERLHGALLTICTARGNLRDIAIAACNGQDYEAVARKDKEVAK